MPAPDSAHDKQSSQSLAAQFEVLRLRYGHLLSAEQLEAVRARLAEEAETRQALYSVPFGNGDEPAFAFRAAPGEQ